MGGLKAFSLQTAIIGASILYFTKGFMLVGGEDNLLESVMFDLACWELICSADGVRLFGPGGGEEANGDNAEDVVNDADGDSKTSCRVLLLVTMGKRENTWHGRLICRLVELSCLGVPP